MCAQTWVAPGMTTPALLPRRIEPRIAEAMLDTPVVLLAGPRQAGKTTLVRQVADRGLRYLTLDNDLTLLAAREDPVGLVRSLDRAVIDEVQRAPQLLLAIKKSVDEDRRPGQRLAGPQKVRRSGGFKVQDGCVAVRRRRHAAPGRGHLGCAAFHLVG